MGPLELSGSAIVAQLRDVAERAEAPITPVTVVGRGAGVLLVVMPSTSIQVHM